MNFMKKGPSRSRRVPTSAVLTVPISLLTHPLMIPQPNSAAPVTAEAAASGGSVALAWLYVGIPLLWGVSQTFIKALALFK